MVQPRDGLIDDPRSARSISVPAGRRPGAAGPAVAGPGRSRPGVAGPGVARPAVPGPGRTRPGVARPAVAGPGVARPAVARPAVAGPDAAVPGPAGPGVAGALEGGHRGGVEPLAEDVLLALQDDAVAGQVIRAARPFERARAVRRTLRVRRGDAKRAGEDRGELELARAHPPGAAAEGQVDRGDPEGVLDLIRRRVRPPVEEQGHRAGRDRRGLGRAAAAHEAVVDERPPGLVVDVRVRDPEALEVDARGDEVRGARATGLRLGREVRDGVVEDGCGAA